jgi:hypothetical protein
MLPDILGGRITRGRVPGAIQAKTLRQFQFQPHMCHSIPVGLGGISQGPYMADEKHPHHEVELNLRAFEQVFVHLIANLRG